MLNIDRKSTLYTVVETVGVYALNQALQLWMDKLNITDGNAGIETPEYQAISQKYPVAEFVAANLVMPFAEEAVFRALPNKIFRRSKYKLAANIASIGIFVGLHNVAYSKERGLSFEKNAFPFTIATTAAHYESLYQRRGYKQAVLSHVLTNVIDDVRCRFTNF